MAWMKAFATENLDIFLALIGNVRFSIQLNKILD